MTPEPLRGVHDETIYGVFNERRGSQSWFDKCNELEASLVRAGWTPPVGHPLAPFPQPRHKPGEPPCGECHLRPGETCDICGARAAHCGLCALGFAAFKAEGIMWHQVNGRDPFRCTA